MGWLERFFVNPQMLLGASAVAVPIIIYLIHRQRYQRRPWAAMQFLLKAIQRHQRKIQIQNLLLLLLRIAILLLLAMAMARPVARHGTVVVAAGKNQNWLVAIDASFSMGYEEDARSLFERAKDTIERMSQVLFKPGDHIALVTLERVPRCVLPPTPVGEDGIRRFLRELEDLRLTTEGLRLDASLGVIDETLARFGEGDRAPGLTRIVLFSDFQRRDWLERDGSAAAGVPQAIAKLQAAGGDFALARLQSALPRANLALVELRSSQPLVATDYWVELRATVRNFGNEDVENVDFSIQVDGDAERGASEPQLGDILRVPAGGSVTRVLPYRFASPGSHTVLAEIRSDPLAIDNRRHAAIEVEDGFKVLLVDGEPAADPLDSETFHLTLALSPEEGSDAATGGRSTPFQPIVVGTNGLGSVAWRDHAAVVLANVPELPPDALEELAAWVRSGGALMVFLGPSVRSEFYNAFLRGEKDPLLPAVLDSVRGDPRYPVFLEVADPAHPIVRYFEEHRDTTHLLGPVIGFSKYWSVKDLASPGTRVAFRYADADRTPAVFDNACGSGRVLWVTSTADQAWNEFPAWPDFVVFLHESLAYLVRRDPSNLLVGEAFRRTYPGARYASEVSLLLPESPVGDIGRVRNLRKAMKNIVGGNDFLLTHEETDVPGIYRFELARGGEKSVEVANFAVNIDTTESDLRAMSEDDYQSAYPEFRFQVFDATAEIRAIEGERSLERGREYWRWLVWVVLALALSETVLAWSFGRRVK